MRRLPGPGVSVTYFASPHKLADPLGWPFGNLPPAELERARKRQALQQALAKLAAPPKRGRAARAG
jgi:hypothetical protein